MLQIDNAHSVGVTGVSWAPATPPGSLVSAQPPAAADKRLASSGCDNAVKVGYLLSLCQESSAQPSVLAELLLGIGKAAAGWSRLCGLQLIASLALPLASG